MRKCQFCAEEIQDEAIFCRHCGKELKAATSLNADSIPKPMVKPAKTRKWAWWTLGILVMLGVLGALTDDEEDQSRPKLTPAVKTQPVISDTVSQPKIHEPPLEILSWHWSEEYGYVTAEGQVKNISALSMENVEAVVSWATKDGEFIKSSSGLLKFNPILPGQTSPFKVMTSHNPAMKSAGLQFKKLFGGTIEFKSKDKQR